MRFCGVFAETAYSRFACLAIQTAGRHWYFYLNRVIQTIHVAIRIYGKKENRLEKYPVLVTDTETEAFLYEILTAF